VRRVIDAHHHLWDLAAREHSWLMGGQAWATDDELARLRRSFTLADLAPLAAEAGVESRKHAPSYSRSRSSFSTRIAYRSR